ncbi:MAG: hypothetical protein IPH75_05035 [bacterium]|nr:hypothetical protein [bacterium]
MNRKGLSLTGIVATAGLLLGMVGCSDNPVAPMKTSVQSGQRDFTENQVRGQVEIYGRVATTNTTTNSLTVTGHSYDVQVPSGAELVFKDGGSETPIEFSQIAVGDSIEVRGNGSGNVLTADRVRIRPNDNANTELEFGGRIEFVDTVTNQIKLVNDARMIFAAPFAELVQRNEDAETFITLGAIRVGDSVEIKGNSQTDGSILASRVRVRMDQMSGGDDFRAEIEFKTTILSVDYANGTLLTAFCWQVVTDSMTFIFGSSESEDIGSTGAAARRGHDDNPIDSTRTRLTLADLKVGDTIEVWGNHLPNGAIYAVAIEVEDSPSNPRMEVEFTDILASVDASSRIVTFVGEDRMGTVDWMADLSGLNNEPLQLENFAAGMRVEVKGFVSDGQLNIVRMHREDSSM